MPVETKTIDFDGYKVGYRSLTGKPSKVESFRVGAHITLFNKGTEVARIHFYNPLLEPMVENKGPSFSGLPGVVFPLSSFNDVYTLLRSEAPLELWLSNMGSSTTDVAWWGTIQSKGMEPVGEWSEKV